MSISKVNSPLIEDPPGYLERFVFWFKYSVFHIAKEDSEKDLKARLIEQIKNQTLCPQVLLIQFNRFVSKTERQIAFENLGRKNIGIQDRILNWIWRSQASERKHYLEIGKEMARQNPYLLALTFERALSKEPCQCPTSCAFSSDPISNSAKPRSESSTPNCHQPG